MCRPIGPIRRWSRIISSFLVDRLKDGQRIDSVFFIWAIFGRLTFVANVQTIELKPNRMQETRRRKYYASIIYAINIFFLFLRFQSLRRLNFQTVWCLHERDVNIKHTKRLRYTAPCRNKRTPRICPRPEASVFILGRYATWRTVRCPGRPEKGRRPVWKSRESFLRRHCRNVN